MTDGMHSYVTLCKNLRIALHKLEELGRILEKDLWVRAHSKENTVEQFRREIAPVELNGSKEITTSRYLEQIRNDNTNLSRYLQHTRTNGKREVND